MLTPPANWNRIKELLADALELPGPERAAWLDAHCDPDLREEIESMLTAYDDSEAVIDSRTDAWLGLGGPDILALNGQKIGKYRLEALIAEGAMAAVYRARQIMPDRTIALKLLRTSLPLADARTRFKREADALARLNHPNIARIYEAGLHEVASPDGSRRALPYLAMEFIHGKPLDIFARDANLNRLDRIRLMIKVIDAVQAAHQQAIIHRDLKPGNVLVDDAGEPKVLDFGIARIAGEAEATTWQTTAGVLLGTPGYMSPEQAAGLHDQVDVRTDVWSLGVMLFELLTGQQPIDVRGASITEVVRRISTDEPRRLSVLDSSLTGELETIVSTALERDKSRRYMSASAFADDLRAFLEQRPIRARAPTRTYVMRKFIVRNKFPLAVALAMLTLVVAGSVASTIGFVQANKARRVADDQRTQAELAHAQAESARIRADEERQAAVIARQQADDARQATQAENLRATRVNEFLLELLRSPDPNVASKDITVLERLRAMEPVIGERFADVPKAEAEVRSAIGQTLFELGEYDLARKQFETSIAIAQKSEPQDSSAVFAERTRLVEVVRWQYRADEARQLCDALLADAQKHLKPDDPQMLSILSTSAGVEQDLGHNKNAEVIYLDVLERRRRVDPDSDNTLTLLNNLAGLYMNDGEYDKATPLLVEAKEKYSKRYGADSAAALTPSFNLAQNIAWSGRYDQAIPMIRECLERAKSLYGPDHDQTLIIARSLADAYVNTGKREDAVAIMTEVIERSRRAFGPTHELTLRAENSLALALSGLDRFEEALAIYDRILSVRAEQNSDPLTMLSVRRNRALTISSLGRSEEAASEFREILAAEISSPDSTDYSKAVTRLGFGQCLFDSGQFAEAESQLTEAANALDDPKTPIELAKSRRVLARTKIKLGKLDEAETLIKQADETLGKINDSASQAKTRQVFQELDEARSK